MAEIVFICLSLIAIHYFWFLLDILRGLFRLKIEKNKIIADEFISILIPFRNEADNSLSCLKSLESQNFPKDKFEIIFIDDNSTDDSVKIILQNKKNKNVKIISAEETDDNFGHKKRAIQKGIDNSLGEIIVTTDADCIHNPNWLKSIINYFDKNTAFVSAPVEFCDNNTIFGQMQKLEFAGLVIIGGGLIGIGKPIICNAANLAFRKSVFYEVGGYNDNLNVSSGDDEFLIRKIETLKKYKIKFCVHKDSVVKTQPNKTFSDFIRQRQRWASKGLFNKKFSLVIKLILIFLFYVSLPTQLILAFVDKIFLFSLSATFLLKLFLEYLILRKGKKNIFPNLNMKYFLLTEILQVPYIIFTGILGAFGNYKWKDRKLKR